MVSGYTGAGSKTVLPSEARAKIDFRMAPDENPGAIVAALRAHLDAGGFGDSASLSWATSARRARRWGLLPTRAMAAAIRSTYRQEPVIHPYMEKQYRGCI